MFWLFVDNFHSTHTMTAENAFLIGSPVVWVRNEVASIHFRAIKILNPITAALETIWFNMYAFDFIVICVELLDEFDEFARISLEKSIFFNFIRRGQFRSENLIPTAFAYISSTLVGFRWKCQLGQFALIWLEKVDSQFLQWVDPKPCHRASSSIWDKMLRHRSSESSPQPASNPLPVLSSFTHSMSKHISFAFDSFTNTASAK